jgi:glycosyltransferase involved in cell wall biosynthesis
VKRILYLAKGLGRGGAEQIVLGSVRHGDRSRFRYEVAYLLPWKDALVADLESTGAAVHCLDGARGPGWMRRLSRLVRERGIDLVHAHSPFVAIGALVYTEHNVWQRYHRATYVGNVLTYPRNAHVFAVSDEVRGSVRYPRPLRGRRMPPVETLYHGPDPAALEATAADGEVRRELGLPERAPVIGTIANFKSHKGHTHLLDAAARVRRDVPDARFVLVGHGPLEAQLRAQADRLGLNGSVLFTGFREDAVRVASSFDVFVLSSLHEGLPISLIEAMSLGTPPVVTAVGGSPEVVHDGEHGLVVPPADPRALADGIVTLLRDDGLRARLGEGARRRAAEFDIRSSMRRMETVYEELLA